MIRWLYEAKNEYQDLLLYYKNTVGSEAARSFANNILSSVQQLEHFPELGVLKEPLLLGKYSFRALFIGNYVCIYRIEADKIYIYHFADARSNYMCRIFGVES